MVAQDGKHVIVKYNIEGNSWTPDNYEKVSTTNTYPEITYFRAWGGGRGGGTFELSFPGIFSLFLGNNYKTTEDDSLQITNVNMTNFTFQHILWGSDMEVHNAGIGWGMDFMGNLLTTGAEEGSTQPVNKQPGQVAQEHATVTGLNVFFGPTYQFNMEDRLLVDASLFYQALYNSSTAPRNSKTFHATGFKIDTRARYYLSYNWMLNANLLYSTHKHDPTDIPQGEDVGGRFSYLKIAFGLGFQW